MGIASLNEMQQASLEANQKNSDVILLSPTGSGKTLAYLLPLLLKLNPDVSTIQALVLAPSRELAQQIEQVFRSMGTGYKVNCCFGGRPMNNEKRMLETPPALLIATPGRLIDHIDRGHVDLSKVHTLVLDEFDKSLEFGFQAQMEAVISSLKSVEKRMLTSATDTEEIPEFTGLNRPAKLNYLVENNELEGLSVKTLCGATSDKMQSLYQLICHLGNASTLVFCNQREFVENVADYLREHRVEVEYFHGGLEQPERERALSKFRNGSCSVFISTDLAARGLDIPAVKGIEPNSGKELERKPSDSEPFAALAFKIMSDPYVGRLTYVRVYSGVLRSGAHVENTTKDRKERIGRILQMHANHREEIDEMYAGDIGAIVGLKDTFTGDTLCDPDHPVLLETISFPEPVIEVKIEPKTKADQDKMGIALQRLAEEDPTFRVKTNEETGQTLIAGMGELHLEIIVARLMREFNVNANVGAPQVAYRETITKAVKQDKFYVVPVELRGKRRDGRDAVHSRAEVVLTAALPKPVRMRTRPIHDAVAMKPTRTTVVSMILTLNL